MIRLNIQESKLLNNKQDAYSENRGWSWGSPDKERNLIIARVRLKVPQFCTYYCYMKSPISEIEDLPL